jgi:HAD superfamily hydrolase (TIGR01549 family)
MRLRDNMSAAQHGARRRARHALWMFDFDNTLAPLEPAVDWAQSRRELQAWLIAQGVAPALFEEFPRGNLVLYEALRSRLEGGGETARAILQGASAIIERYELAGVQKVEPAPEAIELLRALRAAGSAIAVVTSNSSRTVAAWLKERGARGLVDTIVGRDSGLALKPSPAMVQRTIEVCRSAAEDAAFVGDSEADLRAARAATVRFYGIGSTVQRRDGLIALGAGQVFSSPAALAVYLNLELGESQASC